MTCEPETILRTYSDYFENLTIDSLANLDRLVSSDIYFKDPFHEIRGIAAFREVFEDMFLKTKNPTFTVTSAASGTDVAFMQWRFDCTPRSRLAGRSLTFEGASTIRWNERGLICDHRDYWDAATGIYENLPLVGAVMRIVRKGFSA